jgi:heme/copper-type cytochrome/quinol oxidase subunit 2
MRKAIAVLALVALGAAAIPAAAGADGFESDVETIQVVSALVGGKNVFIPSTIVVVAGKPVTLSIFNTTDVPHGFAIPGLKIQEVLPAGQEHPIKLGDLEGGKVYGISCHLHPPHRTATLVVLPAEN